MEFKTQLLRAFHRHLLVPGDEINFNSLFEIEELMKNCKASEEMILQTFKVVGKAYMDWFNNPSQTMDVEPSVFEAFLEDEAEQFQSAPNNKDPKIPDSVQSAPDKDSKIPDLVQPDPVVSEDASKFLKQIVFHLQHMSAQSAEGLDKMELLVGKVEKLVSKIGRLTDEAETAAVDEAPSEVDSADYAAEETLKEETNKDYWFLLYWVIALFVVLVAERAFAAGSLVNLFNY